MDKKYHILKDINDNPTNPTAKEGKLIKKDVAFIYDGDTPYIVMGKRDEFLNEENELINTSKLADFKDITSRIVTTADDQGENYNYNFVYEINDINKEDFIIPVRLANINTPEVKRDKEFNVIKNESDLGAKEASEFLEELIKNAEDYIFDFRTKDNKLIYGVHGRPIAILYVKKNGLWINANRSLIKNNLAEPYYLHESNLSDIEKAQWRFENQNKVADRTDEKKLLSELEDDRERYLGRFDLEKDVIIGDVKLSIPPTQISVTKVNQSNPAEVLRHKTTLQGSVGGDVQQISMEVYFNGLDNINGKPIYPKDDPFAKIIRDDKEIIPVYYINGLRSLLAQFKVTPFLPIENEFLNLQKGISAVTFQNITLSTVDGFPDVIKANLTFLEFNHLAYLDVDPIVSFGEVFDWKLFRFYYQRLIEGTGMKHEGTTLPMVRNSLNTNDFQFSIVNSSTLQEKEDYKRLLATIKADYDLDFKKGESREEIVLNDYFYVEAARNQLKEYKNNYYPELSELKTKFDNREIYQDDYYREVTAIRDDYQNRAKEIMREAFGYNPFFNELPYDPFAKINNLEYFYDNSERSMFVFQDPYNETPVFKLELRDKHNIENANRKIKDLKDKANNQNLSDENNWFVYVLDTYVDEVVQHNDERKSFYISSKETELLSNFEVSGRKEEERREEIKELGNKFQTNLEREYRQFNNLILTDLAISLSNKVNELKLNMQRKAAHQYLGGEEVAISLNFLTSNKGEVERFENMINYIKTMETRYASIIDMPIMSFHNDLVDILGLDGVGYQDYTVTTIPNMPGAYKISLTLIGYHKRPEGFESIRKVHESKVKESNEPVMSDFFSMKDYMRYVNLYPDLELPRFNELPVESYMYDKNDKTFVDPDFYALTIQTLFSDRVHSAVEEAVIKSISHKDSNGARAESNISKSSVSTTGAVNTGTNDLSADVFNKRNTRDSSERLIDSVYDMLVYSKKGRLVRAFPTYYMLLIDEGERVWWWKLHDNFYEYNGVKSIDIVKSRKIAADTCMVTLSNQRGNLTKAESNYKTNRIEYSFAEALWNMTPWMQFENKERIRSKDVENVQLSPGTRLHIRVGYGASPDELPNIFNGTITELNVDENEDVVFVAQSDATELTKPLQAKPNEHLGVNKETSMIINDLIKKTEGGFWDKITKRGFSKENSLGLEHFGSSFKPKFWEENSYFTQKYKDLEFDNFPAWILAFDLTSVIKLMHKNMLRIMNKDANFLESKSRYSFSEISQNIHPASSALVGGKDDFGYDDAIFNMTLYGKTPYDVLQTCALATPNFIGSTHPFGFRSTIFFGHPTWDLVYDYGVKYENNEPKRNSDGSIPSDAIYEKVKPYRQLHYYDGFSDIVSNQISLNSDKVFTAATPIMSDKGEPKELQEVFVDKNIYPDMQKQISIDTSIEATGGFHARINGFKIRDKNEEVCAYRVAKSSLKDYMKEMYSGQIIITGDPSVKPYDHCYISDIKNDINGMIEVEQVVHTLNKQSGFTTSITPDPVVVANEGISQDLNFYLYEKNICDNITTESLSTKLLYNNLDMMSGTALSLGLSLSVQKLITSGAMLNFLKSGVGNAVESAQPVIHALSWIKKHLTNEKLKAALLNRETVKMQKLTNVAFTKSSEALSYITKNKNAYSWGLKNGALANKFTRIGKIMNNSSGISSLLGNYGTHAVKYAPGSLVPKSVAGKAGYAVAKYGPGLKSGVASFVASPYFTITLMIIQHVASKKIQNYLETKKDNEQVLTIIPLKKDGKEYLAGLDGHAGSVLGDKQEDFDSWWDNTLNFIFNVDENEEQREMLNEWHNYKKELDKSIQDNLVRNLSNSSVGKDIKEGEPSNSVLDDNYISPNEQLNQIEGESREEWSVNAYNASSQQKLTIKDYKGIPLQEHFMNKLKSIEEEVGFDLVLSNDPKYITEGNLSLLYDSGLAARIELSEIEANPSYAREVILEAAELEGFDNHGIGEGRTFIHLDMGKPKRWVIPY